MISVLIADDEPPALDELEFLLGADPRVGTVHRAPSGADAVRIMADLDARHAIGIHWGDFRLTDEQREEPPTLLRQALTEQGIDQARFPAASAGDVFDFASAHPQGAL